MALPVEMDPAASRASALDDQIAVTANTPAPGLSPFAPSGPLMDESEVFGEGNRLEEAEEPPDPLEPEADST